jgi:CBS domain-containing protein
LLTFGSGVGWLLASTVAHYAPDAGIDPRVGALVGMTAMFAGASRALMASIAFALEATQQIHAVVPIVAGVTLSYFASCLMMRTTIMTEKLVRRGVKVAGEYDVDRLAQVLVGTIASRPVRTVDADHTAEQALAELERGGVRHQAYPVIRDGRVLGVVTRAALGAAAPSARADLVAVQPAVIARPTETARAVVERMAKYGVGRIVVVDEEDPTLAIGIVSRSDVIAAMIGDARREPGPEGLA